MAVASVVIPTRNNAATIAAAVSSARHQRSAAGERLDVEVIVVDNHSDDHTGELAAQAGATQVIVAGPERDAQRNIGWRAANTEIVAFIDSDMILDPGVVAEAVDQLTAGAAGVIISERAFGDGPWAAARTLEKELVAGTSGEAARVFSIATLTTVGGWPEGRVAAEDWALTDTVAQHGPIATTTAVVWHNEGRPTLVGTFAKKRYYGHWVGDYLADTGSTTRVSPARLAHRPRLWLARPAAAAALVALKLTDAAGVATGMVEARKTRR